MIAGLNDSATVLLLAKTLPHDCNTISRFVNSEDCRKPQLSTMSSSNAVDVSSSDKKLWLVKFPPMVAQRLHAMAGQGAIAGDAAGKPIGRVRVTQIATQVCAVAIYYVPVGCIAQPLSVLRSSDCQLCAVQTSSEFKLQLDPGEFPNIPKEFNMRPHADGVQDAYCFSHQGSGCIGALRCAP